MIEPDWSLYRAFVAVLREGSLSGAARTLGLTQPTLGRQVAELEARLGVALFIRSPQGLHPTETARELAPHAEAMAAAAGALARAASGGSGEARGVVRVTASEIVGAEVLPAILRDFHIDHPGIAVEQVLSNVTEDLLRGEADIAVRMVEPAQAALVSRRLGRVTLSAYGHRRYIERFGAPRTLADLTGHTVVGFDRGTPFLRDLLRRLPPGMSSFAYRADSDLAQLAAIRAGFGLGFIQDPIARRDPDLIPVLEGQIGFDLGFWLVMHEDLRAVRRMRLMYDALAAGLETYLKIP